MNETECLREYQRKQAEQHIKKDGLSQDTVPMLISRLKSLCSDKSNHSTNDSSAADLAS